MSALPGFTRKAGADWARSNMRPGTNPRNGRLACSFGVIDVSCLHSFIVVGPHKPSEMPQVKWVNTAPGKLKTAINGAHKTFRFGNAAVDCFGGFCCRFNHLFDLHERVADLIRDTAR
jgi:hypothetical protein